MVALTTFDAFTAVSIGECELGTRLKSPPLGRFYLGKRLKNLLSGWFLGAGAFPPETTLPNINKTGCFKGPEGYLRPKRSSSRSDDEVFGLLPRFRANPGL